MNDVSLTPCSHFQICVVLNSVSYPNLKKMTWSHRNRHSLLSLIFILNFFAKTSVIKLVSKF